MRCGLFLIIFVQTFTRCFALTISQNKVETIRRDKSSEDLIINSGAYYWLLNNEATEFGGSVDIKGSLFVTSVNGASSDVNVTGESFTNTGRLEFNTLESSAVSKYLISPVKSFHNAGEMYLGISGGTLSEIPLKLTSGESWINTGMIVFERASGSVTPVVIGQDFCSGKLPSISNNGAICLYNSNWTQTTNIVGSGCISVGEGSTFQVQVSLEKISMHFTSDQTINLESSSSRLVFRGLTRGFLSSYPRFKVAGFGGKNLITIDRIFKGYFYDPNTGILKLKFSGPYGLYFDIGKNYAPSRFRKGSFLEGSTISYRAPPPNEIPDICSCKKVFPNVNNLPSPDT